MSSFKRQPQFPFKSIVDLISIFLKFGMMKWIQIDHATLQLMINETGHDCGVNVVMNQSTLDRWNIGQGFWVRLPLCKGNFTLRNWLAKHDQYIWQSILHFKERNSIMTYRTKLITLCSPDLCWLQMVTTSWFWEKIHFALNFCLKFQNYSKVLCKIPYLVNIHYENGKENVILHDIPRFLVLSLLFLLNGQDIIM